MKIFEYHSMEAAKAKQREMKEDYGYSPDVMRVRNKSERGPVKFILIKPTSLLKISGRESYIPKKSNLNKYLPKGGHR